MQCNVQQTDPAAQSTAHVRSVAPHGDIIGWNEVGTSALRSAVRHLPGLTTYMPGGSASAVPISWRAETWALVAARSIQVHGGVAHITPARYINAVLLRHRASGLRVTRINTHVVHHFDESGHPRTHGALPGQAERARRHFRMLADVIVRARRDGPVVIGGDFNVDYLAEKRLPVHSRTSWFPLTELSKVAHVHMGDFGTHGSRAIDWTLIAGLVSVTSQHPLAAGSSDHRPVLTVMQLQKARSI